MKNSQLYQTIFENSEEGIWLIDESNKTVLVNKKLCEILGYAPEEMIGKKLFDFMDWKWQQEAEKQIARRKEGVSEHHEFVLLRNDGSRIWVRLASSPLKDQSGKYVGGLALVSDITKIKREQVLLNAQKNILELMTAGGSLQEALNVLIYAIESVIEGVIGSVLLFDEHGGRVLTGAAPNLSQEFSDAINMAPIGPSAGSCGTAIFRKKTVVVEDIANDVLWKDYKDLALSHGLRACWSNPIISHDGKVLGTFAMYFKEVRKATQDELLLVEDFSAATRLSIEYIRIREQERKLKLHTSLLAEVRETLVETLHYRSILRKIPTLLAKEFADWSLISLENEEGILEVVAAASSSPDKAHLLRQLEGAKLDREAPEGLARAMKERKPLLYSFVGEYNLTPDNPRVGLNNARSLELVSQLGFKSYMVAPIIVRDSIIGGISVFSSDEQRLFNKSDLDFLEQLTKSCSMAVDNAVLYNDSQKSIKSREEFISIASHELRTPLTSLRLRIDLFFKMLDKGNLPEETKKTLYPVISAIRPDLNKFTKLIEMLLDISKLNSSKMFLNMSECNISSILRDELDRIKPEFESQNISLTIDVEENLAGQCDMVRLQQIVMNLIRNALKFSDKKPVEFQARRDHDKLILVVKDNGIGISVEDKKRIFKPFERAVSDKNFGGLGLGLYITMQIVEAFKGKIEVNSVLGEGTTFRVELPLFIASESLSD